MTVGQERAAANERKAERREGEPDIENRAWILTKGTTIVSIVTIAALKEEKVVGGRESADPLRRSWRNAIIKWPVA